MCVRREGGAYFQGVWECAGFSPILCVCVCIDVCLCVHVQEKKAAAKEKMSQMEAELAAASDEIKAQKEREKEQRLKSTRLKTDHSFLCEPRLTLCPSFPPS